MQETIVDQEWRKNTIKTRIFTKVYPHNYSASIEYIEVMPGGNFILMTFYDGTIDIRPVAVVSSVQRRTRPLGPSIACTVTGVQTKLTGRGTLVTLSEREGYVFVEVGHTEETSELEHNL